MPIFQLRSASRVTGMLNTTVTYTCYRPRNGSCRFFSALVESYRDHVSAYIDPFQ